MQVIRGSRNIPRPFKNPVVTLGKFDGLHIGHKAILKKVVDRARELGGTGIVYTFEPHPLKVISPSKSPPLLTTFRKKMFLISQCGIDVTVCADFTRKFADTHPRDFAKDILHDRIGVEEVYVGYNYMFGRGREGTIEYLKKMGKEFGFTVGVMEPIRQEGEIVSSTIIREMIEEGRVDVAADFLGRYYSVEGRVIGGYKVGRVIGYPTANIDTPYELVPHTGVYAVKLTWRAKTFGGVVNIGFNPTFNRDRLSIEVHIFNFDEDIYNELVEICFVQKIRDEQAFKSAEELVRQIDTDVKRAQNILDACKSVEL